ncbi:hypothetical protein LV469_08425 [Peptoniphilus sp. GNH]|nr:hypothetical protein HMPREF3189_00230 [Clostridiales bacterium KA00134]UHR02648.1 hypothetical protein LV469_08425 [Peptoniphilus sp. GNH]
MKTIIQDCLLVIARNDSIFLLIESMAIDLKTQSVEFIPSKLYTETRME